MDISVDQYIKYLKLYNAEYDSDGDPVDWKFHLNELARQISRRQKDPQIAKELRRKQVAYSIVVLLKDRWKISDPPERFLYGCFTFADFNTSNWSTQLEQIIERDTQIEKSRNNILSLGVISPVSDSPITRQAFRWLKEKSQDKQDWLDDVSMQRFINFVMVYGGASICSVFEKPEYQYKIDKILNWRTPYFFEHMMYDVYSEEQLMKIKEREILKIRQMYPSLIKEIKV